MYGYILSIQLILSDELNCDRAGLRYSEDGECGYDLIKMEKEIPTVK